MKRTSFALALALALALTTTSAVRAQAAGAPDTMLFGAQRLSPRAVAVTIRGVHRRLAEDRDDVPALFGTLDVVEDALHDWQRRYPADPRIGDDLRALQAAYLAVPEGAAPAHRVAAWVAAGPLPPAAAALPAPARRLAYAVTRDADGARATGTISAEIVDAVEGVLTVDIAETIAGSDRNVVRVRVDRAGAIRTDGGALSDEQESVLTALSLSGEDMDGVDPGDTWERRGTFDDGRHVTRYTVKAGSPKLQTIAIERAVTHADGSIASWRGTLTYDPAAVVPRTIALSGRRAQLDDVNLREGAITFTLRLSADSFADRQ